MWLASRKPLSIKEHSHLPVLVSQAGTSLMLHFFYTFLCTTHSSYCTLFGTLLDILCMTLLLQILHINYKFVTCLQLLIIHAC